MLRSLALVFVNALDLHIEQRCGGTIATPVAARKTSARCTLFAALRVAVARHEGRIVGVRLDPAQRVGIVEHALAQCIDQQLRQRPVGLEQPAPEGDAIGLVDDLASVVCARSLNTVLRSSSVCSADTPLTHGEPTKARCAMRTRRSPSS